MTSIAMTRVAMTQVPARPAIAPNAAAQLRQKATDFTAVALGELLAPMFDTLAQDGGAFGGGEGEAAFRPMLVQKMAEGMARQGGLGLTDIVTQAMLRLQESKA
jgi:Rod binding domain-containing protein